MSKLFDFSSLAMIPTAYKDGKLYSIRPTDGSGDFTFSRGSNLAATRVDVNGLIEKGRENLLLQSNQFDTTWSLSSAMTITSGQSGYDGTNDAWLLKRSDASARYIRQNVSSSGVHTFSVYAKPESVNWLYMYVSDGVTNYNAYFDLSLGALGSTSGVIDSTIESAANGYYRCSISVNASIAAVRLYPGVANGSITGGISPAGILIQDAQLESGLVATDVISTGASTAQAGILEDLPRLDYSGGASCPSLLLEPQRTNTYTNSEYFDDWLSNRLDRTANNIISPEGVQNAYKMAQQSGFTTAPNINKGGIAAGTYTISISAKKGSWNHLAISFQGVSYFNLETGSKGTINSNHTATIEDYGNGWYRCAITRTTTTTQTPAFYFAESDNTLTTPDTQGYMYTYGAQLEAGSYPTSYIPTYGTSASRAGDVCNGAGDSSLFNDSEGVLFIETAALADDGTSRRISISSGATSNRVEIVFQTTGRIDYQVTSGNSFQAGGFGLVTQTDSNKIAVKYKANDFALWINGTEASTDSSGSTPVGISQMRFEDGGGGNDFYGKVKQTLYFPTALTDSELASLTTI
jgi:hypothetical protein